MTRFTDARPTPRNVLRRDFLTAGAAAVAVGTASFRDPLAGQRVRGQLASELTARGFSGLPSGIAA